MANEVDHGTPMVGRDGESLTSSESHLRIVRKQARDSENNVGVKIKDQRSIFQENVDEPWAWSQERSATVKYAPRPATMRSMRDRSTGGEISFTRK